MNQIRKHPFGEGDSIILTDGTEIEFHHEQDCCETVYADLTALEDTGFFEDETINKDNLKIELVKDYGVKVNGYSIPCYNYQNGYYSSSIEIKVNGKNYLEFDVNQYGESHID